MDKRTNREELIERVAKRTGHDPEIVASIIDTFWDEVYQDLAQGTSVTIKNVGNFYVRSELNSWVFKFNPSQKWRALFGWSSTYKG